MSDEPAPQPTKPLCLVTIRTKMSQALDEFLNRHAEDEFVALTGLTIDTFCYMYHKYCGKDTPICKPVYLFWLFEWYKLYPVARASSALHGGKLKSWRGFQSRLKKWQVIDQNTIDRA